MKDRWRFISPASSGAACTSEGEGHGRSRQRSCARPAGRCRSAAFTRAVSREGGRATTASDVKVLWRARVQ